MRILSLLIALFAIIGTAVAQPTVNIITPAPNKAFYKEATFDTSKGLRLYIDPTALSAEDIAHLTAAAQSVGIRLNETASLPKRNYLHLHIDHSIEGAEGYMLDVERRGIRIAAKTPAGLYYGLQSLRQMVEVSPAVPQCHIEDSPAYAYRGVLIDISRHFRTVEFLKRQIDMMARLKMNRLHLHLTDAAGWRIECESYPRLHTYAAWRIPATWKEWWYGDRKHVEEGTEGAYGGYLTKAEARELVAYAAERYITIIPEIEMPGHSDEVLAAYPELRCTNLAERQGDLCIGKEETFRMMQAILDEIIEIFPSEYIHIGGDEAGKGDWKLCDDCKRRMQEEGLETVDELQSYMIERMERYLNARGRQIIGWDEILEGGLAPNATVMSWRGEEGGIAAAKAGHNVIMSPHGYCYIDAPQDDPTRQPESIGGYLPLERVYSYNPISENITTEDARYILGVQANLWAEFIVTDEHYEQMLWPRAMAIAEVGWTDVKAKDYTEFRERALRIVEQMQSEGYTPFDLKNEVGNRPETLTPIEHLAVGKSVAYNYPSRYYGPKYAAAGDTALTDGLRGGWTYSDGRWQGFLGRGGVDVTIDLGEATTIHSISADFMQTCGPGVFMPCMVEIAISDDGQRWTPISCIEHEVVVEPLPSFKKFGWSGEVTARYVRYVAHRSKHSGFLFTDEIVIE